VTTRNGIFSEQLLDLPGEDGLPVRSALASCRTAAWHLAIEKAFLAELRHESERNQTPIRGD
jgi:hypothetical protein